MEQGSEAWKAARLGRLTASRVADAHDLLNQASPAPSVKATWAS